VKTYLRDKRFVYAWARVDTPLALSRGEPCAHGRKALVENYF